MEKMLPWVLCAAFSYLAGAVPTGFILCRAKGIDIRSVGSGNIGATNVFRALGKGWGVLTLAVDMMKGFVPTYGFPIAAARLAGHGFGIELSLLCAMSAVAGHNWPVYLRFKGGKGVATSAGALAAVAPLSFAVGLLTWLAVFLLCRYVSVASMLAAAVICGSSWVFYMDEGVILPSAFTLLCGVLIWRHRGNIQRLLKGTENRVELGLRRKTRLEVR